MATPSSGDDSKETKAWIKRLNKENDDLTMKNGTLGRQINELKRVNALLKKQNTTLQNKVNSYDKKVERVMDRVAKEVRSLKSDQPEASMGIAGSSKDTPKKRKLEDEVVDESNYSEDALLYGSDPVEQPSAPDTSVHSAAPPEEGLDPIIKYRQKLLDMMMKTLIEEKSDASTTKD